MAAAMLSTSTDALVRAYTTKNEKPRAISRPSATATSVNPICATSRRAASSAASLHSSGNVKLN
jgi:hypothetical protein